MSANATDRGDLHDRTRRRLQARRQRYTGGRRRLVEVLHAAARPVSIPQILGRAGDLSQSSVYRNLRILEQAGVVRRLVTARGDAARFELSEVFTAHHHHLVCRECGAIEDFPAPPGLERALGRVADQVSQAGGFRADHHRVDLVGTCADCR